MTLCVTDSYSQMTVSVNDIYSQNLRGSNTDSQNLHNSIRGVDKRVSQKQGVKSFCPAPCAQAIR
ncbi:hypothetical protein KKI93_14500 [Xenorhabdus bovienii]|nr:hypothetical protein [Xenorhabdus bovienii]